MANVKIRGGDWGNTGIAEYFSFGEGSIKLPVPGTFTQKEDLSLKGAQLMPATEDAVKKLGGAAAFGLAGAALLGPVGLLAGVLLGGNKKRNTGILLFPDGRKALLEMDSKMWVKMVGNTL